MIDPRIMVTVPKGILMDLIHNAELGLGTGDDAMADAVLKQTDQLRVAMGEWRLCDPLPDGENEIDFGLPPGAEIVMEGENIYHVSFGSK